MKLHLLPGSCSSSQLQVLPLEGAQVESCVHELLQLIEVGGLVPCCRSSCRIPSHIPERDTEGLSPVTGVQIPYLMTGFTSVMYISGYK